MLFLFALAAVVLFFIPQSIADPDIWWHLRNAETLVSTHRLIGDDSYSYTARGSPWINHEWIAELPFYFGWRMLGDRGVYLITVLAIELLNLGVALLAYRHSGSFLTSFFASILAAMLCTVSYGPRTILFGWLFLIIELLLLEASERHPRLLWLLPVVFAFWVNTHGSWMIGLVVWFLCIITGDRKLHTQSLRCREADRSGLRPMLSAFALSLGALLLNPYGWRLVAYPLNLAFVQRLNIANVEEWRSLDLHSPRGIIVLACLAIMVVCQLYRPIPWRLRDVALLFFGAYAALTYSRFLVLFSILVLPLLARSLAVFTRPRESSRLVSPPLRMAILFLLICLMIGRWRAWNNAPAVANSYPNGSLAYLHQHPLRGRLLNEYRWGVSVPGHALRCGPETSVTSPLRWR